MKASKLLKSICAVAIAGLSLAATNGAEAKGFGNSIGSRSFSAVKVAKLPIGPIKVKPPIGPIKLPPVKIPPIKLPPVKPPVKPPYEVHNKYRYIGGSVIVAAVGGCYWMKERALETGSRYWWNRYRACIDE